MWDPSKHKKSENEAYINGRASEWVHFPVVSTQIIVPPLFLVIKWYYILVGLILLEVVWAFIRDRYTNYKLSDFVWQLNKVKWIIFIAFGGFYIYKSMFVEAALSFLWPFVSLLIAFVNPKQDYDSIREKFAKAFEKV
ncbi:MAG: hypothetical protein ACP5SB_01755 [Caldisericaceae bacterium]